MEDDALKSPGGMPESDTAMDGWRSFVLARPDADPALISDTEGLLRASTVELTEAGLGADEAFLVALKRVAENDEASREFARQYASGLWPASQSVAQPALAAADTSRTTFWVMMGCAVAAGAAIKLPALFGHPFSGAEGFYLLNLSFFVLPFLLVFLAWVHRPPTRQLVAVASAFALGAVVANVYPFVADGSTRLLTAIHLPVVLWLALGVIAAGGGWRSSTRRMEYVRFTGEWVVTYALIALGGAVLSGITVGVFEVLGISAGQFVGNWVIPCGAMGAVLVAAWLVEGRRNLMGGVAPMLARVFTPLFAVLLVALLVGVIWARGFLNVERDALILFDLLLVLVVALLLYAISARDPEATPGVFDRIQLVLVGCALVVDVFALANIVVRLNEFGFSANKAAALGLNLILLVNLAWSAYLQTGFLRTKRGFADVERWQMRYLPVYAVWAAIVVVAFPPLFHFA